MRRIIIETKLFKNTLIGGQNTKESVFEYVKRKGVKSRDLEKIFIISEYEELYLDITKYIFKKLKAKEKEELKSDLISLSSSQCLNNNIPNLYEKYGEEFEENLSELAIEGFCNYMYADNLIYCIELN